MRMAKCAGAVLTLLCAVVLSPAQAAHAVYPRIRLSHKGKEAAGRKVMASPRESAGCVCVVASNGGSGSPLGVAAGGGRRYGLLINATVRSRSKPHLEDARGRHGGRIS